MARLMKALMAMVEEAPRQTRRLSGSDAAALVDRYGLKMAAAYILAAQKGGK